MLTCSLNLRPLNWLQSVEHFSSINVEGRRLIANCVLTPGSDLSLSNKVRPEKLPVDLQIFEAARMHSQLAKLPQGALGLFSFYDAAPAHSNTPAMDAFLSGWFSLNTQSLEDAWDQVRQGGYSECMIRLSIGPIESLAIQWLWDVAKSPHLIIDEVSISFKRPSPTLSEPDKKKSSSFWRR